MAQNHSLQRILIFICLNFYKIFFFSFPFMANSLFLQQFLIKMHVLIGRRMNNLKMVLLSFLYNVWCVNDVEAGNLLKPCQGKVSAKKKSNEWYFQCFVTCQTTGNAVDLVYFSGKPAITGSWQGLSCCIDKPKGLCKST